MKGLSSHRNSSEKSTNIKEGDWISLTLPHLAGEWKGREEDMEEARQQSVYDVAILIYLRNQALFFRRRPACLGHKIEVMIFTDSSNLNLFAHYAASLKGGTLDYLDDSTNLPGSHQGSMMIRRQPRNGQDRAREQRRQRHSAALHVTTEE